MSATEMVVSRSPSCIGGGSSRWCPTPEQVMLLEGMYRAGLKTPTAAQIQQITSRLSLYGRVQGKNVFYWFQNHKARDRQKLRKKLMAMYQHQSLYPSYNYHPYALQGGYGVVDNASSSCMDWVNKRKIDQTCSKEVKCDCPLMTVMMTEDTSAYCTRVPPKTLQLFPTTTTSSLKDDSKP
ncbi:hypothetical protein LXL04_036488 [Taraxacum kok-saghyz]